MCNTAQLTGAVRGDQPYNFQSEVSATACVHGHDIQIDKTVLTRSQYEDQYGPEFNTYPVSIGTGEFYDGSGSITDGDWFVYRLSVDNITDVDAYDLVVEDTLPE